jgi:hypothetical protein
LIAAASYEGFPLDLSEAIDLSKIATGDQAARVVVAESLPNTLLSTG